MFQKAYIIASLNCISISTGFVFGQMSGVISSLQKREEGIHLTERQLSFIASALLLVSLIGLAAVALITDKIGRRWPFIFFSITKTINWIILYQAREMYQFMLSRIIGGISVGALITLNMIVMSEYTTPNTRIFFLNLVCLIAPAIGTSLGHILGIILQWRTVALIGVFAAALGVFLPYFWVESPHWLASKGRFEECEEAFQKLHGRSQNSKRQLRLLVKLETKKLELSNQSNSRAIMQRLIVVLKKKYMWDIFILNMFMHAYLAASGKLAFSILGSVIIEELTGSSNVLVFTLIVDGFLLLGPCISCLIIRKCSMRILLLSTGFTANLILVILSSCYYFRNGQTYFDWINVGLFALYFIIINTGPYPVIEAMYSEIFPLELKSYMFSICGSILMIAFSLSIFLLPYMVSAVGYHGLFLINAAIMSLSLGYIWLKLPETKGKTLQEIETFFKTKNFDVEEVLSNEQSKALI